MQRLPTASTKKSAKGSLTMAIARWRPNQTVSLRDAFQQLFEDAFTDGLPAQLASSFPVDIHETPDAIEVDAAIPGADVADVEVTTTNNSVMIRAEVRGDREEHQGEMLRQERITGIFQRAFTLPTEIDPNRVEARMENGVVIIKLPKAESNKPKRVEVQGQKTQGNGRGNGHGNGTPTATQGTTPTAKSDAGSGSTQNAKSDTSGGATQKAQEAKAGGSS
jgi:HSP20 family protein